MTIEPATRPSLSDADRALDAAMQFGGKRQFRLRLYIGLFALDCCAITGAFLIANLLRFGDPLSHWGLNPLIVLLPAYLAIAADRRLYSARFFADWQRSAYDAARSIGAATLAVLFAAFFLHAGAEMSRVVVSGGCLLAVVLMAVSRALLHAYAMRRTDGDPVTTLVIADEVAMAATPGAVVLDAAVLQIGANPSEPHSLDRFGSLIKRAERVVIACPPERRNAWAAVLKGANVQGEIVMPELEALDAIRIARFANHPTLIVSLGPLDTRNRILKRGFDLAIVGATIAFIWPLLLAVAIAIQLDSRGPVFFRQPRMGRGNRLFHILKFRSMHADLGDLAGHRSTARRDPRVTRIGRIMRATSIDELPQLLNVLRGDMSVVGPRPHALGSLAGEQLFWEVDPRYWGRHAIKPGITGLAQVSGYRGATEQASDLEDRLRADFAYMVGWTIWRDVRILIATTRVILHRNAF